MQQLHYLTQQQRWQDKHVVPQKQRASEADTVIVVVIITVTTMTITEVKV